jgi:hypothetical protein
MVHVEVLVGTVAAIVIFVLFAPVVPLMHSQPPNAPLPSAPLAFFGSITRATIQMGLEVNGLGVPSFRS